MSWWPTKVNDDVIGDQTADLLADVLRQFVKTAGKPTWAELLSALVTVIRQEAGRDLESYSGSIDNVEALDDSGNTVVSSEGSDENANLDEALRAALSKISAAYQKRWERRMRVSELLSTFEFVF